MPFSMDLAGVQGVGALSIPVVGHFRIPLQKFLFLEVGGGMQWNKINVHHAEEPQPFFPTYVGELGIGIEEAAFGVFFTRVGHHPSQALTLDVGIKFGFHGGLWD